MFHLSLKLFIGLCKRKRALFTLSAICLVCALVSFLYLQEKGYYAYLSAVKQYAETQLFYVSSDHSDTIAKVYNEISENQSFPSLGIVTMSDENHSGIYWDRAYAEIYYVPYGHFFTDDDMITGANVALLGMSYIQRMTPRQIADLWDSEIMIGDKPFRAIGNFNDFAEYPVEEETYQTETLPTAVAIPLNTYLAMAMSASHLRIEFTQTLNTTQIATLNQIM